MTFFLIGYVMGLKEKIKTVMRVILAGISVFVLYTTVTSSVHAQTIYYEDFETPAVTRYIDKLLAMQPDWSDSVAFKKGNKTFFEKLGNKVRPLDAETQLDRLISTIEYFEDISAQEATNLYSVDKEIVLAVMKGIAEIAKNELKNTNITPTSNADYDTDDYAGTTKTLDNDWYDLEIKPYQGINYYIYTLREPSSIKYADFHLRNGSFYHCMIDQCNKVAFPEEKNPLQVHFSVLHEKEELKIDLTLSSSSKKQHASAEEDADHYETTENEKDADDKLIDELNDTFGDII